MAEPVTRKAASARPVVASRENLLPPLRVIYYRKMKRQRCYPVRVAWRQSERGAAGKEITLRLVMGGALVAPAEHKLTPTDPDDKVTFHVTPLAKGWLGDSHIEIFHQDRKVQDMSLPARSATQTMSWWLLLLALIVPWLLIEFGKYGPLQDPGLTPGQTLDKLIADNVPAMPRVVKEQMPRVDDWLRDLRRDIADDYDDLVDLCRKEPIPFYVGWLLLGLAFVSCLYHADKKSRRMGQPIAIPPAA